MKAIHSLWTKPRIYGTGEFYMEDFDILTMILSALKWREKNGEIKLVTDSEGLKYLEKLGITDIWDEIETSLDDIPSSIDPQMFWAAGKLYALKKEAAPVAVIDTDFIVWDKLAFDNLGDLTIIHSEELMPEVYPDIHHFKMQQGYVFNPELDWRVEAGNTAFYVIKNEKLKNEYVNEAISFMDNSEKGDNLTYMVFAEQRLITMTAQRMGIEINKFSTLERLFKDGEKYFTHTWGMKQQMRENSELREDFCRRCRERINKDFGYLENKEI